MTDIVDRLLEPYTQDQSRRITVERAAAKEIKRLRRVLGEIAGNSDSRGPQVGEDYAWAIAKAAMRNQKP